MRLTENDGSEPRFQFANDSNVSQLYQTCMLDKSQYCFGPVVYQHINSGRKEKHL